METWIYSFTQRGKTPCITGLGAHHSKQKKSLLYNSSKFGGALVVFFPYRISETLVGKQPARFPSSGKPQFFLVSKGWAPNKNSVESQVPNFLLEFHKLVTLAKHFWRFDRWWFNWRRVRIWLRTVRSDAQGGLALTGGRWASSDQTPKALLICLLSLYGSTAL